MDRHLLSQLRVFISSTFEDLEEERAYLAEVVFPAFTNAALLHGIQFVEIDLRWGVSKEAPIIKSCIKEIERTHPYFIGIFGKSDGTVPKPENFKAEYGVFDEYNEKIENWIRNEYSITEMEFLYGAIEQGDVRKSQFFWLDYCTHTRKQEDMRKNLLEKGFKIIPCSSISDLGDKITTFLKGLLPDIVFSESETDELLTIRDNQEKIRKQLLQFHVNRTDFDFNIFYTFLESRKRLLIVKGAHGVGKSTILAEFLADYQANDDKMLMISHFYRGGGVENIYSHLLQELESQQGYTYKELAEKEGFRNTFTVQEQFKRFLDTMTGMELVFIVDGLEYAGCQFADEMKAILSRYDNCKLIITDNEYCNDDDAIAVYYPKELTKPIAATYYRDYRRSMQEELLEIIDNSERSWDFHSLRTVLHEIRVFGIHNTLSSTVNELASSTDEQMYGKIISHWKSLLAPLRENDVLEVLSLSHYGMTENTLMQICHLQQHEWSLIYAILRPYIINAGERIWINNKVFSEVIRNSISKERESTIRCRIIDNFSEKKLSDETFDEYPYQLAMTKQIDDLLDYLIDLDVFHYAFNYRHQELLRYWGGLDDDDSNYFDSYVYLCGVGYDTLSRYLDCSPPTTENTTKAEVLREVVEFIEFTLKPTTYSDYDLLLVNKQLSQGIIEEVEREEGLTEIRKAGLLLSCGMAFGDIFINPRIFILQAVRLLEPKLNELLKFHEMNKKLRRLEPYWDSEISIDYCYNVMGLPERLAEVFDIWARAKVELLYHMSKKKNVKSCYDSVRSTMDRISDVLKENRRIIILCALEHNYGTWLHDHGDYPQAQYHLHESFVLRLKVLEVEETTYMKRNLIEDYKLISSCQCRTANYHPENEIIYAEGLEMYCSD